MAEHVEREALLQDISETVLFTVRGGAELPTPEMRGANKVIDRIKSAPAADVVEVVRCKQCRYWEKGENDTEQWEYCHLLCRDMDADDYCCLGAKMDGKGEGE